MRKYFFLVKFIFSKIRQIPNDRWIFCNFTWKSWSIFTKNLLFLKNIMFAKIILKKKNRQIATLSTFSLFLFDDRCIVAINLNSKIFRENENLPCIFDVKMEWPTRLDENIRENWSVIAFVIGITWPFHVTVLISFKWIFQRIIRV